MNNAMTNSDSAASPSTVFGVPAPWSLVLRVTLGLVCAVCVTAHADVLVGPNGERLPGHLVEDKDGVLIFQSDFLGRITVQSDRARVEREPAPAPSDKPTIAQAISTDASPHWASDFDLKLGQDRGSLRTPEDVLDAGWKISRESAQGEFAATLKYKYKRTDNVLKNNDWLASISYDKFLSTDHFATARALGVSELVSDGYNESATLALIWGWRLWEEQGKYVRVGPAVGYLNLQRHGETFDGPAVGFYARTRYPIWGGATFEGEVQMLNASAGNRYAISQIRLKRPLTERLYLATDWLYTWSHVPIETGISSQWRWVLGWSFDPRPNQTP